MDARTKGRLYSTNRANSKEAFEDAGGWMN